GYFTVTEYSVIEAMAHGYRSATDLDVLALRFPGAGRRLIGKHGRHHRPTQAADELLGAPDDRIDLLVCEVKEGRAELNQGARDPDVIAAALTRFGCCPADAIDAVVQHVLNKGRAIMPGGHQVRLIAFGTTVEPEYVHGFQAVTLGHVVRFLREYLRDHWDVLRQVQTKDPAMGLLMTLEKAGWGEQARP